MLGFFHLWELMCKVIIVTNLARKLHLPFFILPPLNILIRLFVISPTTLSYPFLFSSLWVVEDPSKSSFAQNVRLKTRWQGWSSQRLDWPQVVE
jgi:hypothetical protein